MNTFTSEKFSKIGLRAAALSLVLLSAVAISGCSSGGSSNSNGNPPNFGVLQPDLHGDTPLTATRILPDNGSILAAINQQGDVDWFKYEAVANVTYVLQIFGFLTPPPDLQDIFGNQTRDYELIVELFFPNGSLHTPNSSGIAAMYGDLPTGFQEGTADLIGDNRFLWTPPTTGTYFFRVRHNRDPLGTGNYHINLATSQFGQSISITRGNWRPASVRREPDADMEPPFIFNHFVQGSVRFDVDISDQSVGFSFNVDTVFRMEFADMVYKFADDPETSEMHIHVGNANFADSRENLNITDGTNDHNIALTLLTVRRDAKDNTRAGSTADPSAPTIEEFMMPIGDGEMVRLPARVSSDALTNETSVQIDMSGASTRQGETLENNDVRLAVGFPWYTDVHYTTAFALDPLPVASSGLMGDAYSILEAELLASPINLTREQQAKIPAGYYDTTGAVFESSFELLGAARQAHSDGFIRYDAALQAFVLRDRILNPGVRPANPTPIPPGVNIDIETLNTPGVVPPFLVGEIPLEYVGKRIDVHRGGVGQNGPLLIALGTIPAPELPPGVIAPVAYTGPFDDTPVFSGAYPDDAMYTDSIFGSDAFPVPYQDKTIIRKLTNDEVKTLRKAFYSGGFHILIKDQKNGNVPISRAEGFIGINLTPNDPGGSNFKDLGYHTNTGTVRFVSQARDMGAITVIANGEIIGDITQSVPDEIPECGNDTPGAVVSAELLPDDYAYRAFAEDGTEWDGLFTIDGNGSCNTVVLAP